MNRSRNHHSWTLHFSECQYIRHQNTQNTVKLTIRRRSFGRTNMWNQEHGISRSCASYSRKVFMEQPVFLKECHRKTVVVFENCRRRAACHAFFVTFSHIRGMRLLMSLSCPCGNLRVLPSLRNHKFYPRNAVLKLPFMPYSQIFVSWSSFKTACHILEMLLSSCVACLFAKVCPIFDENCLPRYCVRGRYEIAPYLIL